MFSRRLLIANSGGHTRCSNYKFLPVNLYAETVYEITVQDDRFLPILEDTVFHANADYLILLDSI